MRIGIDIRCLTDGKRTGVEEYTINLLENIFELDKENEYVLFLNSYREPRCDLSVFEKYPNVSIKKFRIPNKALNFLFWYFKWPYVDKMIGGVDIFFMPNINFIGLSKKTKLVLTVHDLSYELYPQTFSFKRRLWHGFINPRRLCERAEKIVSVSESTKRDIINRYNISESKVQRAYNGAPENFEKLDRNDPKLIEVKEKYHLPFNFIFFLGTVEPRKNIPAIVRAFDQLKSLNDPQLEKYKLVIAGGKGWGVSKIAEQMRQAKFTQDIIYTSCVTNEDKAAVYTLASLFVYPSFFEGFGIPVLEAMKCSVPVIASNCSSLPEIVGDGGLLIDPDKPDEIFTAMKEILLDKEFQNKLNERAWRQAFKFSWRSSAREHLHVFEKIIK